MGMKKTASGLILGGGVRDDFSLEESAEIPEGLEPVAVFRDFAEAGDYGLAILAMGKAYWTLPVEGGCLLCAHRKHAEAVRREVLVYAKLGRTTGRGAHRNAFPEVAFSWISFALYALILVCFFSLQHSFGEAFTRAGRIDAVGVVNDAEWWRCVTALTLHGDLVHLVSNLVSGLGFAFFVARFFGAPMAWALILLSGMAGNALTAFVYAPDSHYSIGASTAIFGALGLITGLGLRFSVGQGKLRLSFPQWTIPAIGGLTLLGLLGTGTVEVDVAAHISGFIAGTVLGFGAAFLRVPLGRHPAFLRLVESFPLLCLALAWLSALAR